MLDQPHSTTTQNPAVGVEKSSLGIIAESSSRVENTTKDALIRKRFKLLTTAQRLLPGERTAMCHHRIAPTHDHVTLARDASGKATFRHLIKCESYSCPICAFWRAENDRHELSVALSEAKTRGWTPVLLTETVRHNAVDRLPALHEALKKAHNDVFSGRWYTEFKAEWGVVGKIASWETNYGRNGFHPHRHILMFFACKLSPSQISHLEIILKERWQEKIRAAGFDASWEHGFDVRTADSDIADYIAKFGHEPLQKHWGVEHEITRGIYKQVRVEGMTMFDLLAVASGDQNLTQAFGYLVKWGKVDDLQRWAGKLYVQHYETFKGKARIHWGDMWRLLGMDEALEHHKKEAEANEKPNTFEEIAVIPRESWKRIADNCDDMRAELIIFARTASGEDLVKWFKNRGLVADVLIYSPAASSLINEKSTISQQSMFERSNFVWQ